jgi:hypothetical protein
MYVFSGVSTTTMDMMTLITRCANFKVSIFEDYRHRGSSVTKTYQCLYDYIRLVQK